MLYLISYQTSCIKKVGHTAFLSKIIKITASSLILLVLSIPANADLGRIMLSNGNYIEGDIQKDPDGSCWMAWESSLIKFEENEIKRIVFYSKKASTSDLQANHFSPRNSDSMEEHTEYDNIINQAAKKHDLNPALVKAVMKTESNFNRNTTSKKGACGLMQLMPETADLLGVEDIYKPEENINGGAQYLSDMINMFNGDIEKALAAYNAGPTAVKKYRNIPPYKETRRYIKKVYNNFQEYYAPKRIYTYIDENGCLNIYNVR